MRSNNPVLSRPDAWQVQPAQQVSGPYGQYPGQEPYGYDPNAPQFTPAPVTGRMTIDDVITKSAITMGTLMAVAAATFVLLQSVSSLVLYGAMAISGLVAFGTVLLVSFRRQVKPGFVLAYSAVEGVFIGAVSLLFESLYPGIVLPAVAGTFVAAGATLAAYKFFNIKVSSKFRRMVFVGTAAYAGVLLVNFILSFFGLAFISAGNLTMFGLIASAIGVGLAVFNLILDFDYIEQGVAMGAPDSESWRGAFGLTVTMVWLYIEILRILSYFRGR
jgi:uncharacterized YccA/Bax inhibitor family protein